MPAVKRCQRDSHGLSDGSPFCNVGLTAGAQGVPLTCCHVRISDCRGASRCLSSVPETARSGVVSTGPADVHDLSPNLALPRDSPGRQQARLTCRTHHWSAKIEPMQHPRVVLPGHDELGYVEHTKSCQIPQDSRRTPEPSLHLIPRTSLMRKSQAELIESALSPSLFDIEHRLLHGNA
jgi:hypothetical protein